MSASVEMSDCISELAKALVRFHGICPKIPKSSKNPFLNSRYADLSTILEVVTPVLNECDLAVIQMPVGEYGLTTILTHSSGQWMRASYKMQPLESVVDSKAQLRAVTPQAVGSVISYQRRYAIGAVLSLNIDDDNDGNPTGSQVQSEPVAAKPKKSAAELLKASATPAETIPPLAETTAPRSNAPADQPGVTQAEVSSPCSAIQVAEIKSSLAQWEQTQPGVTAQFIANLKQTGKSKLAELSIIEAELLMKAITERSIASFFEASLAKAGSA